MFLESRKSRKTRMRGTRLFRVLRVLDNFFCSMSYRYRLERYRGAHTRHSCPSCGHRRKFVRYIDTQTNTYIANNIGRCNREANCGYHYTPKQYFADSKTSPQKSNVYRPAKKSALTPRQLSFIPLEVFRNSLSRYTENNFIQYLHRLFGVPVTNELIKRFYIGTSNYWSGSTVFWQIDVRGRIRSGKVMLYDAVTGGRVKAIQSDGSKLSKITWAHSILLKQGVIQDFNLTQCLLGEHQLISESNRKPVAIVESEKTAIIASCYLPDFVWLACGSLTNLTADKCRILKGRKIILFPDLKCFEKWHARAKQLQAQLNCSISVSDLLERKAEEADKEQGLDLADYLVKFQLRNSDLPDEIYIPASMPNTIEAITFCIKTQQRKTAA